MTNTTKTIITDIDRYIFNTGLGIIGTEDKYKVEREYYSNLNSTRYLGTYTTKEDNLNLIMGYLIDTGLQDDGEEIQLNWTYNDETKENTIKIDCYYYGPMTEDNRPSRLDNNRFIHFTVGDYLQELGI